MALKKLPGGVIVETDGGARLNEDAGVNLEAIHRQLAGAAAATADALKSKADVVALNTVRSEAQAAKSAATEARSVASTAQSTAGAAKSTADNAGARVTALESAAGFGPSTPEDGQTANFILQAQTQTRKALAGAVLGLSHFAASGDFHAPAITEEIELLRDPDGRLKDGAAWLAILEVEGLPGTWLDKWYGYVSGHDSRAVWLVTAPTPLGPWTYREAVVGIPGSGAKVEEPLVQAHTSSPHVVWNGTEVCLYFHGPKAANIYEQPTLLATSTDGRNFTSRGVVLNTEWGNYGSPYRTSVSYVTTALHDGVRHAIWQGTTGQNTVVDGVTYASLPVGYATSPDGVRWVKRPPIIASSNGDQGLAAPGLIRLPGGWMVVGTYRAANGSGGQSLAVGCYYGPTLDNLHRVGDIVLPRGRQQELTTPTFVVHEGRLWMIGGCRPPGSTVRTVVAFALDWEA